jgi:hypothetical protein
VDDVGARHEHQQLQLLQLKGGVLGEGLLLQVAHDLQIAQRCTGGAHTPA